MDLAASPSRTWLLLPAMAVLLVLAHTSCSDLPVQPEAASSLADHAREPEEDRTVQAVLTSSDGLACLSGALSSGAPYLVCVRPEDWNRDVVVFAPGYRDPANPPSLPFDEDDLSETPASLLFTTLGYAFATTGFRVTGLIDPDTWIAVDLLELVEVAKAQLALHTGRTARFIYQTGGSQGGLATVKAIEEHRHAFSGGLAACGPIGSYRGQIKYIGDFRALFDYYFADVIEGWPVWRQKLPADPGFVDPDYWETAKMAGEAALDDPENATRIQQVLALTGAPIQEDDPQSVKATTASVLWYSFRGTNNAIDRLDGMPYENLGTVYAGSLDDDALNAGIERFEFTAATARLDRLETSGGLRRPLVTMHTKGDPVVPVWHQGLYRRKLSSLRRYLHTPFTIDRYGHCNFTDAELLAAFAVLALKVSGVNLVVSSSVLPDPQARTRFLRLARDHGAEPRIRPE